MCETSSARYRRGAQAHAPFVGIGSLSIAVRVLFVVQRYNAISEPWLSRMIAGMGPECVGVAGRTLGPAKNSDPNMPFKRLRTRNVLHRVLPKALRKYSPKRPAILLQKFAREVKADRILCHYGTVAIEYREAWGRIDLPLFVYFHGDDMNFDFRGQAGSGKCIHSSDYKERLLELSRHAIFIANSGFSRNSLVEAGVAPERIRVNYLGVHPPPWTERDPAPRPQILFVGRFVDCKGPDLTIRAFELLRDRGIDAELVMVGDGPRRSQCLGLAAASRYSADILLPGTEDHSQVMKRFSEATVFTMHSIKGPASRHEEAFGMAFVDAMAAGLPVVGGRSGGVPEVIDDGVTGYLIEPGNLEEHADRLMSLLTDPNLAAKMGRAGWERVCSRFSQERSTNSLKHILKGQ